MDLIHFSAMPLGALISVAQWDEPSMKPQGLWVSDESTADGWRAWCQANDFALDDLAVQTRIHLTPDAHLCVLPTAAALRRFSATYDAIPSGLQGRPSVFTSGYAIDWARVAQDYQGILITPYQWSMRLDLACQWYYGFDCASGCIWDASSIDHVERLSPLTSPSETPSGP